MSVIGQLNVRRKILASVIGVTVAMSCFALFFYPAQQKNALRQSFASEVSSIAQTVALGVSIGLETGDFAGVQKAIDFANGNEQVRFVALLSDGSTVASYPPEWEWSDEYESADSLAIDRASVETSTLSGEIVVGASTAEISAATRKIQFTALTVAAIAILIGVLVAWWLAGTIVTPIKTAVDRLTALAGGDLTQRLEYASEDELGAMASSFNSALDGLTELVTNISNTAGSLAASSEELATISGQMGVNANDTSEQAGTMSAAADQVSTHVHTAATGAEEMGASIKEIAKNSSDAARVATAAAEKAKTTNDVVGKLGDSSAEIGNVIKTITSIAEQTNLLALNATIEAARAGEAGKGFAVVANEVKELAKETAKATEDIRARIEGIQSDTGLAVEAIADITMTINEINDIQNTIASAVEEQTATTAEIGRTVTEAAKGSSEIAHNSTALVEVAQGTSGGANDTQNAAGELSRMAADLQNLVAKFRIDDDRQAM